MITTRPINDQYQAKAGFDALSIDSIRDTLASILEPQRYVHSIEVANISAHIASHLRVPVEKAELAGLLHDCSRYLSPEQYIAIAKEHGYIPDEIEERNPILLHAFVSSVLAQRDYYVSDEEVLAAIRKHTTGDTQMTTLDKIVYIADFIDPSRGFDSSHIKNIRTMACSDIDKAALMVMDDVLVYLKNKNKTIHPRTLDFRFTLMNNYGSDKVKNVELISH